ncbi:DUF3347 domain-containing protein [Taibaiella chishuiensis]|uniref:Uncharacterized protein DUF3347 n=1 Tax=Taibaiella chishuiensis TaxID=1434707 RepID=A0A2P8D7W5_9BACT|nr:DUF3347 domain-containing protein [Taibaiella chishuiensis]PSK93287.1 uncharacterized protein DUF3347 [Taibaiella chishuiensis]
MKKILFLLGLLAAGATTTFAQDKTGNLLNRYYSLKDALVSGNTTLAAEQAKAFAAEAGKDGNKAALVKTAGQIAASNDIEKQRSYFSSFSDEMVQLVKTDKSLPAPVYKMYCPMKKASWLSAEQQVRNPYFGNKMLTCGSVAETIK